MKADRFGLRSRLFPVSRERVVQVRGQFTPSVGHPLIGTRLPAVETQLKGRRCRSPDSHADHATGICQQRQQFNARAKGN